MQGAAPKLLSLSSVKNALLLCFVILALATLHHHHYCSLPQELQSPSLSLSPPHSETVTSHTTRPTSLLDNATHVFHVLSIWKQFEETAEKRFKKLLMPPPLPLRIRSTSSATQRSITDIYLSNQPFPHMYFDNIFPPEVLEMIMLEIPESGEKLTNQGCPLHSEICWVTKTERKAAQRTKFSLFTNLLINFMKSNHVFIGFLENLSNITSLIPDSHNTGSGVHQIVANGYLKIHADFNRFPRDDTMHRRVNAFVFLNPDWKDDYGGHLELWTRNLTRCKPIFPSLGRLAVFNTDDFSYHGHPEPLNCPANRSRRSIAQYYYTTTRPVTDCENFNCTLREETKWVYPTVKCFQSEMI